MIQKSISATSELLNKSQSRERKGYSYRAMQNINKQSSNRQYDRDAQRQNPHEFAIQPHYTYGSKPLGSDGSIDETGLSSIAINSFSKDYTRLQEFNKYQAVSDAQTHYQPYINIQNQVMSNAETFAQIPGVRSASLSGDVTLSKSTIEPSRALNSNTFFN